MPTTVSISPDNLPDITATLDDDGVYEFSITGFSDLAERPREPTPVERADGILSSNPPTIRTSDITTAELLMLRAVEMGLPEGTLDNVEGEDGSVDKQSLLLVQLTRVMRRALWELETLLGTFIGTEEALAPAATPDNIQVKTSTGNIQVNYINDKIQVGT